MALLVASFSAFAEDLPIPPIPPQVLSNSEVAPVPNVDAQAPTVPVSEKPSINVKMYRARAYDPGVGFTPGSRYQTSEDRKPIQTPGFAVTVPLK
ncbi:MAG TPA: hypothetical protein DDZ81_12570 [Acetobacteraceae bacterium]|nr:hypothetical protein [Acetobacteraceae bacterium]